MAMFRGHLMIALMIHLWLAIAAVASVTTVFAQCDGQECSTQLECCTGCQCIIAAYEAPVCDCSSAPTATSTVSFPQGECCCLVLVILFFLGSYQQWPLLKQHS